MVDEPTFQMDKRSAELDWIASLTLTARSVLNSRGEEFSLPYSALCSRGGSLVVSLEINESLWGGLELTESVLTLEGSF